MSPRVAKLAASLLDVTEVDTLHQSTAQVCRAFGLSAYDVAVPLQDQAVASLNTVISSLDERINAWRLTSDTALTDPRYAMAHRPQHQFVWSEAARELEDIDPTETRLFLDRIGQSEIEDALTTIVRSPAGVAALVTLFGPVGQLSKPQRSELALLSHCLAGAVGRLQVTGKIVCSTTQLSRRIQEVLHLGAIGFTSAQISERLGITKRTVDLHFTEAVKTMGAATRLGAIAKAYRLGLIDLGTVH